VRIDTLADHPELVDTVARWHWDEWGSPQSGSFEDWAANLRRGHQDRIPVTFVALDERDRPLGSVTMTEHDMPGHLGYAALGPWIAGTFVAPEARGTGVGAALMQHAVEQAHAWDVPRLYLYTESARAFYEHLGWTTLDEVDYEDGRVAVMTLATDLPFRSVPGSRRLSQRISEGDGIAIIARVDDAGAARDAELQGAKAVAVTGRIDGIREATTLPLLWLDRNEPPTDADAVRIRPEDDAADDLEAVVDVRDDEELELALERLDPEIFLLRARKIDKDVDPLDAVLELLPDVPAGKLAIAEVEVDSRDEVLALERAGIDAVLVTRDRVADLVGHEPLDV
jgi:GNAT superfamily N-acetyltransferase